MSISSISLTFFSMTGAAAAPPRVASTSPATNDAPAPATQSCEAHGAGQGRRNVLYEAMMAALREMGLTGDPAPAPAPAPGTPPSPPAPAPIPVPAPAPAPAAGSPVPAAPNPTGAGGTAPAEATPAPSVEEAVFAFAHALWQALRGSESGRSHGHRHDDDHEGHHGHQRHRHGDGYEMSRGYSGLATRLDALAVRFDASTGAVNAAPAAPASSSAAADPAAALSVVAPQASEPAGAVVPAAASPATTSPLSQAFDAMMRVLRSLNPTAAPSPNSSTPSLPAFLHSLARGLNAERATPAFTGVGVVINITA